MEVLCEGAVEVIEVLVAGGRDGLGDEADCMGVTAGQQGVAGGVGDRCVVRVQEQRQQGLCYGGVVCCWGQLVGCLGAGSPVG